MEPYHAALCEVDKNGNMIAINERLKVYFAKDGSVVYEENGEEIPLASDTPVSMNFWGFTPAVFKLTEPVFKAFVEANENNPKAEFFIPLIGDELIKRGEASFKVIPTDAKWFGVTYKEDKPIVQKCISDLVESGVYPENLWP